MKKVFKTVCVLITFIIVMSTLNGCGNKLSDKESLNEKVSSEISYLDGEIVSIINAINGIEYEKYTVKSQEIKSENKNSQSTGEEQSSQENSGSDSQGDKADSSKNSSETTETFYMKPNDILGTDNKEDWDKIKSKIDDLYTSIPTILVDLKKDNINQKQIDEFSKNLDHLAVAVKNENSQETINSAINVYKFLPEFARENNNAENANVLESKYCLLICYKNANEENWEEFKSSVTKLKMNFSNILNNRDKYKEKQVDIENAEAIINEISNESFDKDIFFLKYKNLMQELDIL